MARWVLVSRRRSRRSNPGGGRRVASIRAALESVMGGSWRYLTDAEKGLVITDVASMVRGGDDGGPWGEFDSSAYESARLLRQRLGGAVNLKSYAQTLAAGRRYRWARRNPGRSFRVGDIVRYRAAFLQSVGWYTNVPEDGKVIRLIRGTPWIEVEWSDGETRTVAAENVILRGKPDYSERKNPGIGMPGMPHTWVTKDGVHVSGGDVIEFRIPGGLNRHGQREWSRTTGSVQRGLVFDDHVVASASGGRNSGYVVSDENFLRLVRRARRRNPGSWVARIGKGGKAIGGGATKAEAVKAARIYMKRDPSCKRVWVGRA